MYEIDCLSKDIEANINAKRYSCDVLVIAIPPRGEYLEVLRETLFYLEKSTQVILLSSISFYDGKPLVIEAEALVQSLHEHTVVLRLGGLMGYERIAGKYTAGKVLTSNTRTNYVHRDDVVGIIYRVISLGLEEEVFDVVAPVQCMKKEIFTQNAKAFDFKDTEFLAGEEQGKVLSPIKLCKMLDYDFVKKDVLGFWDS